MARQEGRRSRRGDPVNGELAKLMRRLQRQGVTFAVVNGEVHIRGKVCPSDLEQLGAGREQLKARLEARELRRQRRGDRKRKQQQEQQQSNGTAPQERKVVGMVASPRYPQLAKALFEDECKSIAPSPRARQLVGLPYGWTK